MPSNTVKKEFLDAIKSNVKAILMAIIIAITFRSCFYDPFHIPSSSMEPTLLVGDKIFVNKFHYGYSRYSFPFGLAPIKNRIFKSKIDRGDIVVFKLPSNTRINYIKRVIGLPGDKIQVKGGFLHINNIMIGKKAKGEYRPDILDDSGSLAPAETKYLETLPNNVSYYVMDTIRGSIADDTPAFTVPEGMYFMMGDNRDNSQDSRFDQVGFVPERNIVGKANNLFISSRSTLLKFWGWFKDIRVRRCFRPIPDAYIKDYKFKFTSSSEKHIDELLLNQKKLPEKLKISISLPKIDTKDPKQPGVDEKIAAKDAKQEQQAAKLTVEDEPLKTPLQAKPKTEKVAERKVVYKSKDTDVSNDEGNAASTITIRSKSRQKSEYNDN